jgi:DNA-binding CsgD family transcriptional regulator/N-acetylneuraminic acid mutarotase
MSESTELSEREQEILRLVATGASNKEIAYSLSISANTVKVHLRNIFAKIGAVSRTEAAMYAVQHGLVEGTGPIGPGSTNGAEFLPVSEMVPQKRLNPWIIALILAAFLALMGTTGYLLWKGASQPRVNIPPSGSQVWQENSSMPTARYGLATTVFENRIYAIAGRTASGETGTLERYNPELNSWDALATKPTAVSDVSAAVIGGKIYVPGGRLISGEHTDRLEIYNPRIDSWSEGSPLPEPVSAYALAVYEGKLFLFGGWNGEDYLPIVLEYDPDQNAWSYKTPLSHPRAYAAATEINGKIYILGGFDGNEALKLNEYYSPDLEDGSGEAWTESVPLPSSRYGMGVTNMMENIYLIGGVGNEDKDFPAYWFSTRAGEWQEVSAPPMESKLNFGFSAIETNIYVIGGRIDENPVNHNLEHKILYITVLPILP